MSQPNDVPAHQMSLWTLQALVAGGASFGGALGAALQQRAPFVLGASAGFVWAALATLIPILIRRRLLSRPNNLREQRPPRWLGGLYVASWLWIILAAILAHTVTDALLVLLTARGT